jgi:phosphatidate cytidylyltransferase
MTPSLALESRVFLTYLAMAAGLLALGGAVIGLLAVLTKRDVSHAKRSYGGWLVMIPAVMLCIFLGRIPTILLFALLSAVGFKEYARATGLYQDWWMTGVVYLAIAAIAITAAVPDPSYDVLGWYGLFMALPAFVLASIFAVPILRNQSEGQVKLIALAAVGFIYIGWMFGHAEFLADSKHAYGYILYLLFAVEINDVAAFTFGRFFGRRQLRSNISPKKTWGGALGALGTSLVLPWVLWFSFPHFGVLQLVLTGLIVGIGGQFGDLSMSIIKRDLKIKDMGTAIAGHGGILDRIDSMIYVAPLFFHMVRWFHGMS